MAKKQIEHATARRYSEIASQYSQDWRGQLTPDLKDQVEDFSKLIGKPPKRILDAGCGTGKIGIYLAEIGYEVFGLDLSAGMLKEAVRSAEEKNVSFTPIQANIREQSLPAASIDAIWSMASIVHLDQEGKSEAIAEFSRLLADEGILHISVQNLLHQKRKTADEMGNICKLFQRYLNGYAFLDERHWFFPTKPELINLLQEHGFEIIDTNSLFSKRNSIFARKI